VAQVFAGHMPFLSPNQQCQHTEGTAVHKHCSHTAGYIWSLVSIEVITKHGN